MLLSEEFIEKTRRVSVIGLVILVLECAVGFLFAIIAAAGKPVSSTGLFEYLSGTRGIPNESKAGTFVLAAIGFPFYCLLSAINFFLARSMLRDTFSLHKGSNEDRILSLRRKLLWIMIGAVCSVFTLILHGSIWGLNCIFILTIKYRYLKEVKKLNVNDIGKRIDLLAKKVKRSLESDVYALMSKVNELKHE